MGLWSETAILIFGMLAVCCLPLAFKKAQPAPGILFLFATGALFGICVFDLIPDVVEIGGQTSLYVTCMVGVIYSLTHLVHLRSHGKEQAGCESHTSHVHHSHSFPLFFASIFSHCFASGILLAISSTFSVRLASAVFLALLAHKAYECLIFVSLLLHENYRRSLNFILVGIYCLALPIGVGLAAIMKDQMSQTVAAVVSSIAVGSLLGCLVFDFMLPSFQQIRQRRRQVFWIFLGLALTRLLMGH